MFFKTQPKYVRHFSKKERAKALKNNILTTTPDLKVGAIDFIAIVRCFSPDNRRKYFHKKPTSYNCSATFFLTA
jgi:hypothetical protein